MIHWEAFTHLVRTSIQSIQTELKFSEMSETLYPVLRPQCKKDTDKLGQFSVGPPGWTGWSICTVRRGWESWAAPAWRKWHFQAPKSILSVPAGRSRGHHPFYFSRTIWINPYILIAYYRQ